MPTALVTGASSGIGLAFARHLAAAGHDLVLVARREDRLRAVADDLSAAHEVACEVLAADLTERAELQRVADRAADAGRPVDLLVNNAGISLHSAFLRSSLADQERLLDVHCRATLVLTHAAGRAMAARGRGAIVNVSSVAGLMATGTYSAVKAWATTFSEAMAVELRPRGVTVTALCPGYVRTDLVSERTAASLPPFAWVDVDRLVATCLDDVRRGKVVSVPTRRYRAATVLLRRLPRALVRRLSAGVGL